MRGFRLTDDQRELQGAFREFLADAHPPELVREFWESDTGRSAKLWAQLVELGVVGVTIPEEHDGLGLGEVESTALLEEAGYALLAEPLTATMAVAAPMLLELGLRDARLSGIASGDVIAAVGLPASPLVADAHVASVLLLEAAGDLHAVAPGDVELNEQVGIDRSRRLFTVRWDPKPSTRIATGAASAATLASGYDRAVLATSAELLGVTRRLIDSAVAYAREREQFGQPIGSFQAIKHLLADALIRLEFARPVVYFAAASIAAGAGDRSRDVSMAKAFASEAAHTAARVALQVHGAIGYTWEDDLHFWLLHSLALNHAFGDATTHRARVATSVLALPSELASEPGSN